VLGWQAGLSPSAASGEDMFGHSFRAPLCALLAGLALMAQGCNKGAPKTPADRAEVAVEEFLDAWSRGESPDKFASSHPGTTVSDPDWKAGTRLLSFLCAETKPGEQSTPLFRCRVALSLRDRKGKAVNREVTYEVVPGEKYVIRRVRH
jgi:hypothetical protein